MSNHTLSNSEFLNKIREAGIVGEGGAGFPAHVKYDTQADMLIANGCECEPLLYSDQHIMKNSATEIVSAMQSVMSIIGAKRGVIGLKKKYTDVIGAFKKAIGTSGLELAELDNFYPAGDEQILIHEITGKTIKPLGLPKDEGIVVANVGSLFSVARAMDGIPVTDKVVTVTGEVATPSVVTVPIGTPIMECVEQCGGALVADPIVLLGGPMMGPFIDDPQQMSTEVITKTTGGIIILPRGHALHEAATLPVSVMQKRAATACIQCRLCTELCPRYLVGHGFETHKVMRAFSGGVDQGLGALQAMMCCECGVCELFACPMRLSPRRINQMFKERFREQNIQYDGPRDVLPTQTEFRSYRKVPTTRLAMKIDIERYLDIHPDFTGKLQTRVVRIPLQQHIGAPSVPVVSVGDQVSCGDCIAEIPEKSLGAKIHASIDGVIKNIDSSITIEGT